MKRIMLDTSVYGKLVEDTNTLNKLKAKNERKELIVYGSSTIRKELRATSKKAVYGTNKLRILLLSIYDQFISKDDFDLKTNKLVELLSDEYFAAYKKNSGNLSMEELQNDFVIIATATIYQLDVVVSDDERSMLADKSIAAYRTVNAKYGLINPNFKRYSEFKRELSR